MEDSAIKDGFAHLRGSREYDNLYVAAAARSQADWLVGMNSCSLIQKIEPGLVLHAEFPHAQP